jgi:hypothetical protein
MIVKKKRIFMLLPVWLACVARYGWQKLVFKKIVAYIVCGVT